MAINAFFPCSYRYPFTNDHELNLGWVLATIKAQESELSKFVALNTVKYADPFDWNITSQYATNTVVFNPADMTAYLSVQPVPSGVQIDNTDYWTPIFTLADIFTAYKTSITPIVQESAQPATHEIKEGQLLWIDNVLYAAARDIAQGTVIVPGENVLTTNISDELAAQEAAITTEQSAREQADHQLQEAITAEQSAREQADQQLQEAITAEQTAREQADQQLEAAVGRHVHALEWYNDIIYVSNSGNDSNDGTQANPLLTLQAAIEKVQNKAAVGYIFIISGGTFPLTFPTINAIQLHIVAQAPGVVITWANGTDPLHSYTRAFYNTYLHLEGYNYETITSGQDANTILRLLDPVGGSPKNAYLEAGKLALRGMVVEGTENCNFGVVGAFSSITKCYIKIPFIVGGGQSYISDTFFSVGYTNCSVSSQKTMLLLHNGCLAVLDNLSFIEGDNPNLTYCCLATNSFLIIRSNVSFTVTTTPITYFSYCNIMGSKGVLGKYISNGNALSNCVISGELATSPSTTLVTVANIYGTAVVTTSSGHGSVSISTSSQKWSSTPYIVATAMGNKAATVTVSDVTNTSATIHVFAADDDTYTVKWFATGSTG